MDALIFCVLSALLTPPQMPASTETNAIGDVELKRVLVLTNLRPQQCYNVRQMGTGQRVGGGALPQRLAGFGAFGWREEEEGDRGTMSPTTPTPDGGCLCTVYQNAARRIPSVLHSLTVCLPNNGRSHWDWVAVIHTQINLLLLLSY